MSNQNTGSRILWVERAQLYSMLLVVLHHAVPRGFDGPEWLRALLTAIQYPALVCFFFTSGLLSTRWRKNGWGAYMKKRALRLLTPFFCVNLLMLPPRYAAARLLGYQVSLTPRWFLLSFLDPHGQGIAPHLWFLPTLFIMGALLPAIHAAVSRGRAARLATLAVLLVLSALPFKLPTLLCLNELKLYLAWYAAGYALALTRGTQRPLRGAAGLALGAAGLTAFALALCLPQGWLTPFIQMLGGAAALVSLAGLGDGPDPLVTAFRGKTYVIYILSMCAQNLVEVAGYAARLPWALTMAAMLAFGLAAPLALHAWNARHPLPRFLRLMTGL